MPLARKPEGRDHMKEERTYGMEWYGMNAKWMFALRCWTALELCGFAAARFEPQAEKLLCIPTYESEW